MALIELYYSDDIRQGTHAFIGETSERVAVSEVFKVENRPKMPLFLGYHVDFLVVNKFSAAQTKAVPLKYLKMK